MSLVEAFRALRERWLVVLVAVLVALAAGGALYALRPPVYTATLTVYASPRATDPATTTPDAAYQASLLAKERIPSYQQLATSPQVLSQVIARTGIDDTVTGLASKITPTSTAESVLIDIAIQGSSPQQAVQIAETMSQVLPAAVDQLEQNGPPGSAPVSLRVVRPIPVPDKPSTPGLGLTLGLALLAGVVAGVAIALIREALDRSVRTRDDVAAAVGLPVLGAVPARRGGRGPSLEADTSETGEAYRQLRTAMHSAATAGSRHSSPGVLAIASPGSGEGRTSAVTNLAVAAAGAGMSVLVIDADLRRPRAGRVLGVDGRSGLTDVLAGGVPVESVTATSGWGADVLATGPLPSNPAELLAGGALADLFEDLGEHYSLVLVDVPPLLPVTDAAVVAAAADGVVVLARRGTTSRDDLAAGVRTLETAGAHVLGTALVGAADHRQALPDAGERRTPMTPRRRPSRPPVREVTELPVGSAAARSAAAPAARSAPAPATSVVPPSAVSPPPAPQPPAPQPAPPPPAARTTAHQVPAPTSRSSATQVSALRPAAPGRTSTVSGSPVSGSPVSGSSTSGSSVSGSPASGNPASSAGPGGTARPASTPARPEPARAEPARSEAARTEAVRPETPRPRTAASAPFPAGEEPPTSTLARGRAAGRPSTPSSPTRSSTPEPAPSRTAASAETSARARSGSAGAVPPAETSERYRTPPVAPETASSSGTVAGASSGSGPARSSGPSPSAAEPAATRAGTRRAPEPAPEAPEPARSRDTPGLPEPRRAASGPTPVSARHRTPDPVAEDDAEDAAAGWFGSGGYSTSPWSDYRAPGRSGRPAGQSAGQAANGQAVNGQAANGKGRNGQHGNAPDTTGRAAAERPGGHRAGTSDRRA